MPEANAHQRYGGRIGRAQKIFERRDPGVVLVSAVAGAGDQPAVLLVDRSRHFTVHNEIGLAVEALAQHGRIDAR